MQPAFHNPLLIPYRRLFTPAASADAGSDTDHKCFVGSRLMGASNCHRDPISGGPYEVIGPSQPRSSLPSTRACAHGGMECLRAHLAIIPPIAHITFWQIMSHGV